MELSEYIAGQIWLKEYPVRYLGFDITSRMAVLRLSDSKLMLHSPCEIDAAAKDAILALGEVAYIVAPGSFHYLHILSAQAAFPDAETYICPGIEKKQPGMDFDWILGDRPAEIWQESLDQVLIRGTRFILEVAFFHKPSKTLLLVDLIENVTDQTPHVGLKLKLWRVTSCMWNRAKPAPEYQFGWKDKAAARRSLQRILKWDFERIVVAHGNIIEYDARAIALEAWKVPLGAA